MSAVYGNAPKPASALGYHRILSPSAGVKVSPLCLGAMNFGDALKGTLGECDKTQSFKILDTFFDMGGNFVDTSSSYQHGQSEQWLGEWMKLRNNRDQMVIATKYASPIASYERAAKPIQSNYFGNSVKTMKLAVERSLVNLQTDYLDILYVHWWTFDCGVEEVMNGLNDLVRAGKVLYLGASNTPAWVVVKANMYARQHGMRPFSVFQGKWNAAYRDIEREIAPMCEDQGMAIAPWGPLGQGLFKSAEARKDATGGSARAATMKESDIKISDALERVATQKGTTLQAIALAYILNKAPNVFPIIGQRKVEHLKANIEALSVELDSADMTAIDSALAFDPGYPASALFGANWSPQATTADTWHARATSALDIVQKGVAIKPHRD